VLEFNIDRIPGDAQDVVKTQLSGIQLLMTPLLNKGTAFTANERHELRLDGLLPPNSTTLDDQVKRVYREFQFKQSDMEKHIYLRSLQDRNEVLFYRLLLDHIEEMMPLVYTPTVGAACRHFSHIYRRPRGLFISYPERADIVRILNNRIVKDVDIIVVTDGERILGLGDQGAGGMGIPIGKLSLYTLCGGIHPARTLPILLDVGTDNEDRINNPFYLGWRHSRIRGEEYERFIDDFVLAVKEVFPHVLLQWEDFSRDRATQLLERYRDQLCTFNDDIQGTASVTVAALISAMRQSGTDYKDQRVVLLGAGSAAIGIAHQLADAMIEHGLTQEDARSRFWVLDSKGLVHAGRINIKPHQMDFVRAVGELADYPGADPEHIGLKEVVAQVHPTVLIGVSGQPDMFTREIVEDMAAHVERPVVFPLSNPTSQTEATPAELIDYTEGRALVATGSPFAPVEYGGRSFPVAQCNNSYVFPGVGLGVVSVKAKRVTPGMFMAASIELARIAAECPGSPILPPLSMIRDVSRSIAVAVGLRAVAEGIADPISREELSAKVDLNMWNPHYPQIRLAKEAAMAI